MIGKEYFMERKTPIIMVVLLLIIGSMLYFTLGISDNASAMGAQEATTVDASVLTMLKDIQLKAAYTEEGNIDMFALAKNNAMAKLKASQGNPIPEVGGMVVGNVEGSMMQEEDEFKNVGDTITDYDLNFKIDGVLSKTGTFADDFHFINIEQYNKLNADSGVLLVKFKNEKTPKLFYIYDKDNPSPANIEFADGNMNLFYKHINGKKTYYPIIIGAKEAKMMQEEKLFTNSGDIIKDFFGKDVIVVGIAKEANTSLDMMHIVEEDFFDDPIKGVLV